MLKSFLLLIIFNIYLIADISTGIILDVKDNSAFAKINNIQVGVSGFIVREFSSEHSSIIANALVKVYDANTHEAEVAFSEYDGLRQNSLPSGKWQVQKGDKIVLAFGYSRAILIAPTEEIFDFITSRIKAVTWMHPDEFATFLSYRGHPTPLKEDIADFCTLTSAGLAYIFTHKTLFTLDCQSFKLLQVTEAPLETTQDIELPFHSRIHTIREAWWGDGSNPLESYDYYTELMVEYNSDNEKLQAHIMSVEDENISKLMDLFETKEK